MRIPPVLYFLALALCACASERPARSTTPINAPPDPAGLAEITPPAGMRVYGMVLLRRGPKWTAEPTPESKALGEGHMANIQRMAAAGKLKTAGPFLGQTDSDDLAGIYIFSVTDLDEIRQLTAQDPAVAAGRFVPEYLIWMGPENLVPEPETSPGEASPDKASPDEQPGNPEPAS